MLDTPSSEVVWRVLATHSIRQFPLHFPSPCVTVCHHISTGLYSWLLHKDSLLSGITVIWCQYRQLQERQCGTNQALTAFEMWWYMRRNQISSFDERDQSIYIGGSVSSVDHWQVSCAHHPAGFVLLVQAFVLQSCDAYWLPTPFSCFPFTSPTVRHRVPSRFNWTLTRNEFLDPSEAWNSLKSVSTHSQYKQHQWTDICQDEASFFISFVRIACFLWR